MSAHCCIKLDLFINIFLIICTLYKFTFLSQTFHTSPSWSGRERRVCMVRKYLTFSNFLTFFFGSGCRILGTKWLPARVIRDNVISAILAGVSVTSRKWRCSRRQFRVLTVSVVHYGQCIKNAEKWPKCMCAKVETWWDRKQVNKELQLQLLQ